MSFESVFKINGKPILSPILTDKIRMEIIEIRNACKANEERLKRQKDLVNEAKKNETMRSRSNSYTISTPTLPLELLQINSCKKEIFNQSESSIKHQQNLQEVSHQINDKKEEERHQSSSTVTYDFFQPQLKTEIHKLIERQKKEYLETVNLLKRKFQFEQQQLLRQLQAATSTPIQNVSLVATEDDDFTEFQTCLQTNCNMDLESQDFEKTLVNNKDEKENAATKINAYVRGYLVRRLLKTSYVQESIRNIQDTLQLILTFDKNRCNNEEIQDILLKTKLFQQLQSDLYRLSGIFFELSIRERMKIISADRAKCHDIDI